MSDSRTIRILSGEDRSLTARLVRGALCLASPAYALATDLRNLAYDWGRLRVEAVSVPVISIGNLTTGGTGKTPTVAWLVQQLASQGRRPGILSRGYRSLDGRENDEKRLLDRQCPGHPHLQYRDRIAGARRLIEEFGVDVIVLDDGFQHRRLHRDLDIVLIDALNPWGFGSVLPRGLMRERARHLRRAGALIISRCELADELRLCDIERELTRWTPAPIFRSAFEVSGLVDSEGTRHSVEEIGGRSVCAFCGIGNPGAFRRTLTRMGTPVADERFLAFPDHHHYEERDLQRIGELGLANHAELILTTGKDLVKLPRKTLAGRLVLAVDIELRFLGEGAPLLQMVHDTLRSPNGATALPN